MTDIKRNPKVGLFLVSSERFAPLGEGTKQGTYLERKLIETDEIIKNLSLSADVVFSEICDTEEKAKKNVELFKKEKVDCVVVIFLSWAEDAPWISFLSEMTDVPLLYASVVRNEIDITDTNDENQFVNFLSYGSLVGFLVGSGSLKRYDHKMSDVFLGTLEELADKVKAFANASKAKSVFKESSVSLLSGYNEIMRSTYVDPYNLYKVFGAKYHFISVLELVREIEKTDDEKVKELCKKLSEKYFMADDVEQDKFFESVKATFAMENLAKEYNTDLFVLNDVDKVLLTEVGLRPGFSPLDTECNMAMVPEGDVGAGLAAYLLKILSGKQVNFIEPFYVDKKRGVFAGGHASINDYTECPENVIIGRDTRFAKSNYKYAGAPFAWYVFPEGIKTLVHISECNGKIKLACTKVECLKTKHYLASYSHADFKSINVSNEELFEKLARFGVTQHYAIVSGDYTKDVEAYAKLMGFEYLMI